MNYKFFLLTLFCLVPLKISLIAQEPDSHDHDHHHGDELGIAIGIVPLLEENKLAAGMHIHYIKGIGELKWYGLGLSAETIVDEHKHYTISLVNQFRPYKGIILSYAPGLLMLKEESLWEYKFAQHFEVGYEFEIGHFHIGPMADISFSTAGLHYMAGLHFGINI